MQTSFVMSIKELRRVLGVRLEPKTGEVTQKTFDTRFDISRKGVAEGVGELLCLYTFKKLNIEEDLAEV
jgi:hypothetical protein